MTIPEKIARAKELAEKATPGPWETDKLGCMVFLPIKNSEGQRYGVASATDELKPVAGHYSAFEAGSKDEPHANMRFIAESRTLLPDLARECERLQGEKDEAESHASRSLDQLAESNTALFSTQTELRLATSRAETAEGHLSKAEAEVERLRKLVEDAPHELDCDYQDNGEAIIHCTCFKSRLHLPE